MWTGHAPPRKPFPSLLLRDRDREERINRIRRRPVEHPVRHFPERNAGAYPQCDKGSPDTFPPGTVSFGSREISRCKDGICCPDPPLLRRGRYQLF